jgi:hypothetical protein
MDVCEVGDELVSGVGGGKAIGIGGEFQVVTLVCEERSGSGGHVVVCKLGNRKPVGPVILLIVTVDVEVLLQCLIYAFGLTIGLGVVTRREVQADTEECTEGAEEVGDKLGTAVRCDVCGDSVSGEDILEIQLHDLFGRYVVRRWEE